MRDERTASWTAQRCGRPCGEPSKPHHRRCKSGWDGCEIPTRTYIYACALTLLSFLPSSGIAQQQIARARNPSSSLPDAPLPKPAGPMEGNATGDAQGTASISGTILDSTGAAIPGAQISLALRDGSRLQTVKSGANGEFTFAGVPAGSYRVTVEAVGFALWKTEEFTVATQQVFTLPAISLSVAAQTTSV